MVRAGPVGSLPPLPTSDDGGADQDAPGHEELQPRSGSRRPNGTLIRRAVGAGLTAVGVFLAMVLLYLYAFSPLSAARDQQRLLSELTGSPATAFALVQHGVAAEGSPVGLLRIPALHLQQVIVEGTSAVDLESGPGHMPGTALPGAPGNAVVAGRRVTFGGPFGDLGALRPGDVISVDDGLGHFEYRVDAVRTVLAGQADVVTATRGNRLTLVTSDSPWSTTGRLVVTARLRGKPATPPKGAAATDHPRELALGGDPSAAGSLLLWLGLLALAVGVTAYALWRWRRPRVTYVLAVPVLLACGLFAAEALARCLPATL